MVGLGGSDTYLGIRDGTQKLPFQTGGNFFLWAFFYNQKLKCTKHIKTFGNSIGRQP